MSISSVADLGEGPLILEKKKRKSQKEEKPVGKAKQIGPPPLPLSSRSGSATAVAVQRVSIFKDVSTIKCKKALAWFE